MGGSGTAKVTLSATGTGAILFGGAGTGQIVFPASGSGAITFGGAATAKVSVAASGTGAIVFAGQGFAGQGPARVPPILISIALPTQLHVVTVAQRPHASVTVPKPAPGPTKAPLVGVQTATVPL
jgi:hypothetical protein